MNKFYLNKTSLFSVRLPHSRVQYEGWNVDTLSRQVLRLSCGKWLIVVQPQYKPQLINIPSVLGPCHHRYLYIAMFADELFIKKQHSANLNLKMRAWDTHSPPSLTLKWRGTNYWAILLTTLSGSYDFYGDLRRTSWRNHCLYCRFSQSFYSIEFYCSSLLILSYHPSLLNLSFY